MHDVAAFVARAQLLPGMEPADGSLNDPAIASQSFIRFDAFSCYARGDSAFT